MALLEKKRCIRQRKHCLTQQFKEGMILLYSFVSTGSTLEQAFVRAGQELLRTFQKDDDIVREFDEIRRKLGMNITVEACVADFAKRSHQEDIESFAQIISIAKRSGGSMSQIMKNSVETLKNKIESEAQIRTILSAKRGEFKLMVMIPLGVMFYMRVFFIGFYGCIVRKRSRHSFHDNLSVHIWRRYTLGNEDPGYPGVRRWLCFISVS